MAAGAMKLTRLTVQRYRDVPPGTQLRFHPSFNVVLGENGTGRTALLELLSTVLKSDFSGLAGEVFSLEYELVGAGVGLDIRVQNEERPGTAGPALVPRSRPAGARDLAPRVEVRLKLDGPALRLLLRADAAGVAWEVDGRQVYAQTMEWALLERSVWVLLFMMAQRLKPEVRGRLKGLLRRTFLLNPARFDEGLGTFDQLASIRYGMELQGDEVFPVGLMMLPSWMPAWLRERVVRGPVAHVIEFHHGDVAHSFLARFVKLASFAGGTLQVELLGQRAFEGGGWVELGRFGFCFTRRDGTVLSGAELGHGQKRLLSFLYYLDVNEDFVVADELAGGLQPRWVAACMAELGERQAFLTSLNPLLFEHLPLESPEGVALLRCAVEWADGRERRVWSNLAAEGVTPGELLRAQGVAGGPGQVSG